MRLRTEPALWLLPLSVVVGHLAATGDVQQSPGYPLAEAVRGHAALLIVVPLAGASAAWKAGRYRRAGWASTPRPRDPARVLVSEVCATVVVQLVAYALVRAWTGPGLASPIGWQLALAVVAAAVIAGWSALAFVVGWFVRVEFAMPLVLMASYASLVTPLAFEPLWVRHLTGLFWDCCAQDAVLARGAVAAPILVGAGLVAGAVLTLHGGRRLASASAALVVVGVAALAAVGAVHGLGVDPIAPRAEAPTCAGRHPEVCLWPEQRTELDRAARIGAVAHRRLVRAGFSPPERFTVRPADLGGTTAAIWVPIHPTDVQLLAAIARGVVPGDPPCGTTVSGALTRARDLEWALVARLVGVPAGRVLDEIGWERGPALRALEAARPASMRAWVARVDRAAQTCADDVPGPPR